MKLDLIQLRTKISSAIKNVFILNWDIIFHSDLIFLMPSFLSAMQRETFKYQYTLIHTNIYSK